MINNSKEIWLGEENKFIEFSTIDEKQIDRIPSVASVNLIFGKNNSRKSRFLRTLLGSEEYQFFDPDVKRLKQIIIDNAEVLFPNNKISKGNATANLWDINNFAYEPLKKIDLAGIAHNLSLNEAERYGFNIGTFGSFIYDSILLSLYSSGVVHDLSELQKLYDYVYYHVRFLEKIKESRNKSGFNEETLNRLIIIRDALKELLSLVDTVTSPHRIYIPALRMTRNVFDKTHKSENILKADLEEKYALKESDNLQIYDGLDFFNRVLKLRNSIREKRSQIENFEKFISETFFENKQVDLVADIDQKNIRLFIEGDEDRLLYNLGDGVQNILILLYPIFTCPDESWIFIEEPELNMHPGMQSLFLRTILNHPVIREKKLRFFIVTHSNHLLDVGVDAEEVSFFTLTNNGKTSTLTNQLSPNNNVLKELGVFNSSVLMSNCSIWVEGISDRLFLKAFLKVYYDEFKKEMLVEGYNYSYLEYAGNNLVHYDFKDENDNEKIKSFLLSNRIFLLADRDKGKEDKHNELAALADGKDFIYQTTESKEIENLIPPKLLKAFLVEHLKASKHRVEEYTMKFEDYTTIGFGTYLEQLAVELKIKKKKFAQKNSNTGALNAYYKKVLAEFVYDKCNQGEVSWSDLAEHEHTKKIVETLTAFLKTHN